MERAGMGEQSLEQAVGITGYEKDERETYTNRRVHTPENEG
jgi:hypothetical protein